MKVDISKLKHGDNVADFHLKTLRNNYAALRSRVDVTNLTDFMIAFMFGNSEDEWRSVSPNFTVGYIRPTVIASGTAANGRNDAALFWGFDLGTGERLRSVGRRQGRGRGGRSWTC